MSDRLANRSLTDSEQRLVKIIRFSQVAMLLTMLNYLIEAVICATPLFSPSAIIMVCATLLVELAIRLIYAHKPESAFSLFLVVITMALFLSMLTRGGLYSAGVVGIPVVILFSVLYGRLRDILCLLLAIVSFVIFLSQTSLASVDDASSIGHQLPIVAILISVGGYISWAIGNDMRKVFSSLHAETVKLEASQASIQQLSKTDFLTGLLNAKQASINYEALLKGLPKDQQIYFYFIDLDGFKEINDLFDHKAGDNLLVLIADRLKSVAYDEVSVCRLSGDEFIIFFTEALDYKASTFAEHVLDTIAKPHNLFGTSAQISASVGIAITSMCSFNEVRKKASVAMYRAKRESTNHYYLFSDTLEEQYMRSVYITQGLKTALKDDLLSLHFQPKIDLETSEVNGMEALIRWTKDNPRNYTPEEFMSVIESTELVHDIGNWVIKEACLACKQWHQAGYELPVAVNVSAQQLLRPDFAETVLQALSASELEGRYLEVELTERFFVDQSDATEKQLAILRQAGVCLTIDDFGTGYSNVSYLMNLEADVLKLDKSFIARIHNNAAMKPMIEAIVDIARVGRMKVVAEGVETIADSDAVTALGCDFGQGYYWSKPVAQQAVIPLLEGGMAA